MAKKKKQQQNQQVQKKEEHLTIGDQLGENIFQQLKNKKNELQMVEQQKLEEDRQRKAEEARLREKNKSFEELFGESKLSWKDFK